MWVRGRAAVTQRATRQVSARRYAKHARWPRKPAIATEAMGRANPLRVQFGPGLCDGTGHAAEHPPIRVASPIAAGGGRSR